MQPKDKVTYFSIALFIGLLILVTYKSEIVHEGLRRGQYFGYYIIATSLLIISIFQIFLSKNVLLIFRIVVMSGFISLYLFEFFLTFKQGEKVEAPDKKSYYKKYRTKNPSAVSTIFKNKILIDNEEVINLGGISNRLTLHCKELDYWSDYISDRYGFNNPDMVWENDDDKIILVGDSFIQGACVKSNHTISQNLRYILPNKNIIALGMSQNSLISALGLIKEYVHGSNVKHIFIFYYEGNDLVDLDLEYSIKILKNYLDNENFTQNLRYKQNEIDSNLLKFLNSEIEKETSSLKGKIYKILTLYNFRNSLILPYVYTGNLKLFKKVIEKLEKIQELEEMKIHVVYLPEYFRFVLNKKNNQNYKEKYKIEKIIKSSKLGYLDLTTKMFYKNDDPLNFFPYKRYGHYTEQAYKEIANHIKEYLN